MKEAPYYDTTSRSGAIAFAKALGAAFGLPVVVDGPRIVLPPELGTGRLEFYEVNQGFAIGLIDCVMHQSTKLVQGAVAGSDNYRVLFNIGDQPWQMTNHDGSSVQCGTSLADAVLFTSNSMNSTVYWEAGQHLKAVMIHFQRNWSVQYLLHNTIPIRVNSLKQFVNYEPMQFLAKLDLRSQEFVEEMLQLDIPVRIRVRKLEGYAYQLMALFFNNMVEAKSEGAERFLSEDAMRVMQLKEQQEQGLDEPIMPLEKAAEACLMSRTKFIHIFRKLFQKNYGVFFQELKMDKAKILLAQGLPIAETGYEVGYINPSHFIKAFRLRFGITPGTWQQQQAAGKTMQ